MLPFDSNIYTLHSFRLIPFDLGYSIKEEHYEQIAAILKEVAIGVPSDKKIFGTTALFYSEITKSLDIYIFGDGIGAFLFREEPTYYEDLSSIDTNDVLNKRKISHSSILDHQHAISPLIDQLLINLRKIVRIKKRRLTSYDTWEHGGLSYVFSFYFLDTPHEDLEDESLQTVIYSLLNPDEHTFSSDATAKQLKESCQAITRDCDPLSNVHLSVSWATILIIGKNVEKQFSYYCELEVALQHIWLYSYITEKMLDEYFLLADGKISAKTLTELYNTLVQMTLTVSRYDSIFNSRTHARDSKVFQALQESSNVGLIIESIKSKSEILERKLRWTTSVKSLNSDRLMETLLLLLTILQCITALGLTYQRLVDSWIFPIAVILLVVVIAFRFRR